MDIVNSFYAVKEHPHEKFTHLFFIPFLNYVKITPDDAYRWLMSWQKKNKRHNV